MGLFDNIFGGLTSKWEMGPAEGFAGILLGAIAADGHISSEEAQGLVTNLTHMKMYESWSPDKFNNMMDRLVAMLKREGPQELMKKCAATLPTELRETAFANACDLVLADGIVEGDEKEYLEDLQRELDVSGDTALSIIEVMIIKNRG